MIKVKVTGTKELSAFLSGLPKGMKYVGMEAVAQYVAGDETHGLRHYPEWRGQRYTRTFNLRNSWSVNANNSDWRRVTISNSAFYAEYVPVMWGSGGYINYGWLPWLKIVSNNLAGAIRSAQAAVNALLARKGK